MYKITLPQAGKDINDATVSRWLKQPGQAVRAGEVLLVLQARRAEVHIQADRDTVLDKILAGPGSTVAVGELLAVMDGSPAAPEKKSPPAVKEQREDTPMQNAELQVTPVLMPQAGNTMEEGTIVKWHVKQGDQIKKGDVIFEVETDKATVEVEAMDQGRLAKIVAAEGDTIEVLQPVAYLAENDADVDAFLSAGGSEGGKEKGGVDEKSPPAAAAVEATPSPQAAATQAGRPKASPAARKQAKQRGVDLSRISAGSGPGGRIVSSDIPAGAAEPVRRKMSPMRKAIARNLQTSKQNIPHFYIELTIDAAAMMSFYRAEKAEYQCSVNNVIVRACAIAIAELPEFRSRIEGDELIEFPSANIGIAVGLDDGLVVPVLQAAERLNLRQTADESRRLAEAARGGKIEGMNKGVFTISNMGMFGIERFSAIINPPESAILAVGAVREAVVVAGGAMRAGQVMTMTLSCDHRVIDGTVAAKFLARLKELLETPQLLA